MPSAKRFEQACNAQASVDLKTMCITSAHVTQTPNDKQEIVPPPEALKALPEELGRVDTLLADTGYFSESNVEECIESEITLLMSSGRQKHNQPLQERFSQPEPLPDNATAIEKMHHWLKTSEGKKLYGKRKSTVEPVFGIIKEVMGFRQFLLRGYEAVSCEWTLVSIAWNLKRMYTLNG